MRPALSGRMSRHDSPSRATVRVKVPFAWWIQLGPIDPHVFAIVPVIGDRSDRLDGHDRDSVATIIEREVMFARV